MAGYRSLRCGFGASGWVFRVVVALLACGMLVLLAGGSALAAPVGAFTEFPVPTASSGLEGIAAGPDGNLWFTETGYFSGIGRISPSGTITDFPLPTAESNPVGIAAGPDGNMWFTESYVNKIGRVSGVSRGGGGGPAGPDHRLHGPHGQQQPIRDRGGPGRQPVVH